jgi:aspartate/methionine/tyrosine aminotransferase
VVIGSSPITTVYSALHNHQPQQAVLDLAQAAPDYPPASVVLDRIVATARNTDGATYTDVPGLPELRSAFAVDINAAYGGAVLSHNVVITAGCNQAFCLATSALAEPGSEVIVPLPYYFNHDMWLRLNGITPVYLEPDDSLVPRADTAAALITNRTRAILLVTPGNPSGITIPPAEIDGFAQVARSHDLALVLDETYRLFRDDPEPAHGLYRKDWQDTVVGLYSFSKELAIPGYRVGAVVAAPAFNDEIAKLLDCVAVCAPRIGQEAAQAGLVGAQEWRKERVVEIARRREAFRRIMSRRPGGFELLSCGGFFGWIRHPFTGTATEDVVRDLAVNHDTILMPGTAFLPDDRATIRVSVGNCAPESMEEFARRLIAFSGIRS